MLHIKSLALALTFGLMATAQANAAEKYAYDSVPGDPLHAKIYTLTNGLKIFMSQNPRSPRIQANIAVRVGGKNDPAETTGLAHYFEHMMFKGTPNFGTTDYTAEKPMLDRIEALFETYRHTTDSMARAAIYHQIDSISYEASKLAIPNEYDKMMSAIGASGTNAYTSTDVTCYVEEIPSNELERWAIVQADRFKNPVLRGFHTELETIYEEKNMSLTNDSRKAYEQMLAMLFPSHPYGTQTVLGTQTHLKNPSITNIKAYHDKWYVPNNMAIVLSGDFNPDEAVDIISRYFGDMKPNTELESQRLKVVAEKPFSEPQRAEVWGNDAERLFLAWRIPANSDKEMVTLQVMEQVLQNGSAGLIDIDINQAQKLNGAGCGMYNMADQGAFDLAKESIDKRLRTERVIDDNIAWAYINAIDLGIAPSLTDPAKQPGINLSELTFEALPSLTLADVVKFQQANIKGRVYHYGILGKIEDLDMDALNKLGRVVILTPEDIFGY